MQCKRSPLNMVSASPGRHFQTAKGQCSLLEELEDAGLTTEQASLGLSSELMGYSFARGQGHVTSTATTLAVLPWMPVLQPEQQKKTWTVPGKLRYMVTLDMEFKAQKEYRWSPGLVSSWET
ncbi:uncharacterized protein LOC144578932 [Callithrix jacchus]